MNVLDAIKRLDKFSEYEGTELGEYHQDLMNMYGNRAMMSDEFLKALKQEIIEQAKVYEGCRLHSTVTQMPLTTYDIEWPEDSGR